ncbi:MAG: glycosyltransferase family 2 protein [Terrimicrobiaceae bacterium]
MTSVTPCEAFSSFAEKTLVIVPAHNEEECVGDVVRRLQERGFLRIRVVDNGSTDATARIAATAGAEVLSIAERGYGLACWEGALELPEGIAWLLYCNADASDDFDAYEHFAKLASDHDLILGARNHPEDRRHLSAPQRFGNWLAPFLIRRLWGHSFSDLGPQRAIRVDAYRKLNLQDRGFGWTIEMQIRAIEENLRVIEIPVRNFPRPAGQSKISGNLYGSVMAGLIILRTLAHLKFYGRTPSEKNQIAHRATGGTEGKHAGQISP